MKKILGRILVFAVTAAALVSGCKCNGIDPEDPSYDKVLILYSAGYNSLSNYLKEDIQDVRKGFIPAEKDKDIFLIVSHLPQAKSDYTTATSPQLIRVYSSRKLGIVMDTVKTYPSSTVMTRPDDMKSILSDIKASFKTDHYGMIFSSHASGWLPAGYYNNPDSYERRASGGAFYSPRANYGLPEGAVPYVEPEEFPGAPDVKSIGMTNFKEGHSTGAYEIDLQDFPASVPMHMDYIVFDACLNGGIEVAYQLKDVCDVIAFSQAEVLAEGLDYTKVGARLLQDTPDVVGVATDYFEQYAAKEDVTDKSATISVVDCSKLGDLTSLCRSLFSKYREQMDSLDPDTVQRYYRSFHHWYYDLEDILVKAGISASEQSRLEEAIDKCILYKAASEAFLEYYGGFKINAFSGLSMYLPCNGSPYLDSRYKLLEWNKATELVD